MQMKLLLCRKNVRLDLIKYHRHVDQFSCQVVQYLASFSSIFGLHQLLNVPLS